MLDAQRRCADDSVASSLAGDASELLKSTLGTLSELEQAMARSPSNELSDEEQEIWVGFCAARAQPSRVEDVWFVAGFELNRALGALDLGPVIDIIVRLSVVVS